MKIRNAKKILKKTIRNNPDLSEKLVKEIQQGRAEIERGECSEYEFGKMKSRKNPYVKQLLDDISFPHNVVKKHLLGGEPLVDACNPTYSVKWSDEDNEYVGLCDQFPGLSWLAETPEAAEKGIRKIVAGVLEDIENSD